MEDEVITILFACRNACAVIAGQSLTWKWHTRLGIPLYSTALLTNKHLHEGPKLMVMLLTVSPHRSSSKNGSSHDLLGQTWRNLRDLWRNRCQPLGLHFLSQTSKSLWTSMKLTSFPLPTAHEGLGCC